MKNLLYIVNYKYMWIIGRPMRIVRLRRVGSERVICVPRELLEKVNAEYLAVDIDGDGRIVYTPVKNV
jgi:hypothetical protein